MNIAVHYEYEGKPVLAINTGLRPEAFAKSRLPKSLDEKGFILRPSGEAEEWLPIGTFCAGPEGSETVYIYGKEVPGIPLLPEILENERGRAWEKLYQTVKTIRAAAKSAPGIARQAAGCGPAGIFIADEGSVFILPLEICIRSIAAQGNAFEMENRLFWIHPDFRALPEEISFSFMAGTLAYYLLCGKRPFIPVRRPKRKLEKEAAPAEYTAGLIRKNFFEPAGVAVWALKPEAAEAIDGMLRGRAPIQAFLDLGPDFSALFDAAKVNLPETQEFQNRRTAEARKRESRVRREAFIRYNIGKFFTACVLLCGIVVVTIIVISEWKFQPTTLGLTPDEVLEDFYDGIHTLNGKLIQTYAPKAKTNYHEFINMLFITAKIRETIDRNSGIITPAELFADKEMGTRSVFGITGFMVAPVSRTEAEAVYTVSFYLWVPMAAKSNDINETLNMIASGEPMPAGLSVYHYIDDITVSYVKDRWIITSIKAAERTLIEPDGEKLLRSVSDGSALELPYAPVIEEIEKAVID
ncbi:hypothetical protein K7I13_14800 [Brucepastera parasyntrophica]|uniref:hypothetical protein n=1 Tax=Brucepastera parasyntrophica TaxID=2880008 RepID=UPI00210CA322|nr:hypothetical protein [Brucepastera parasyntrophica]ULQ59703.1 hypothetical protein K7I13_14800 [Brucepastera parasyntrophica]